MKIQRRFTKGVLFESKHKTMKGTVVAAVKIGADLSGADLSGADLSRVILCDTKFSETKITYRGKPVMVNFTEV